VKRAWPLSSNSVIPWRTVGQTVWKDRRTCGAKFRAGAKELPHRLRAGRGECRERGVGRGHDALGSEGGGMPGQGVQDVLEGIAGDREGLAVGRRRIAHPVLPGRRRSSRL
jgi:hypothetical protein